MSSNNLFRIIVDEKALFICERRYPLMPTSTLCYRRCFKKRKTNADRTVWKIQFKRM